MKTALVLIDSVGIVAGIIKNTKSRKLLKSNVIDAISNSMNNEVTGITILGTIEPDGEFVASMWVNNGTTEVVRDYSLTSSSIYSSSVIKYK